MIPSRFHMDGKNLYSQTLHVVFLPGFVCVSFAFVTDADENKFEYNLQGLRVKVFATLMK